MSRFGILVPIALLVLQSGCRERRAKEAPTSTYDELEPVFERACTPCHDESQRAGGYVLTDYLSAIGCTSDGRVATLPASADAPLVRVFERSDHESLVSAQELAQITGWVEASAPAFRGTVHTPDILDPRAAGWHGKLAAQDRFRVLHDPSDPNACGRCHDGAPVKPAGFTTPAPDATACTSCHDQKEGVLACSTCHGSEDGSEIHSYPPRDACYFGSAGPDAHAAHVAEAKFVAKPFDCGTCHPEPSTDLFAGAHADGSVDVRFDATLAGAEAAFHVDSGSCTVACHARGGQHAEPAWHAALELDCQSCHLSPPTAHYPGSCNACHAEMGAAASSLVPGDLHVNGKVDVGNGLGGCAACHGSTPSGAPADASHRVHLESPLMVDTLLCGSCHSVPAEPVASGSHMNGSVDVHLMGLATARGQPALWDMAERRCDDVACHGAGLSQVSRSLGWSDSAAPSSSCTDCHGAPPPPPHVQTSSCGGSLCHDDEVGFGAHGLIITGEGRMLHIDGTVTAGQ